jgi:hypothetical protein
MASANDPNTWKLDDIKTKEIYAKFISAERNNKFNHDKLKELVVDAARFFREKAKKIIDSQLENLSEEGSYRNRLARNRANKQKGGPALRQVLSELLTNISSNEEEIKNDVKELDSGLLGSLLSQEIFLSVLSLNTLDIANQGKKYIVKTPVYLTKTKGGRIAIPISVDAAEIIQIEKEHGQSDLMRHISKAHNNVNWVNVKPAKAKPKNAIIAVGPVVNYPANNTRRRGVIREVNRRRSKRYNNKNGNNLSISIPSLQATNTSRRSINRNIRNTGLRPRNVQAGTPNFSSAAAAIPASPAKPNRGTRRNAIGNVAHWAPIGINRGANPAKALQNRRLSPRGPAGALPQVQLPNLPELPYYRLNGGTRKKKNK